MVVFFVEVKMVARSSLTLGRCAIAEELKKKKQQLQTA
jgi:hypothetical protein